jgi:hypothetical protein
MASPRKTKPVSIPPLPAKAPTPIVSPTPAPVAERSEFKGSGTPKAPPAAPRTITQDQIARRAYDIYASRGYAPGDPTADWYEAERQLRAGL